MRTTTQMKAPAHELPMEDFYAEKWRNHKGFWIDYYAPEISLYADVMRKRNRAIERLVQPCERILDVGCGIGDVVFSLADRCTQIFGVDISPTNIALAQKNLAEHSVKNAKVEIAGVEQLPYIDDYFDYVVLGDVIEHLKDPDAALGEIYRTLKPGGRLLCITPDAYTLEALEKIDEALHFYRKKLPQAAHVFERFFTKRQLLQVLSASGYEIEKYDRVCFYPGPEGGGLFARFLRKSGRNAFVRKVVLEGIVRKLFDGLEMLKLLNQKQLVLARKPS